MASISVPAAIIGAGAIGGVASIATGAMNASAASDAANAQVQSNDAAIGEQQREFDVNQANLQPWLKTGQAALGSQGDLLGLNGADKQSAAIAALQGSPLYTSLMKNGQDAILANASATGGLRGGNIQDSLARFSADALSNVIQNQFSNLGGLSGQGAVTGADLGKLGLGSADAISSLLSQNGSARASGLIGSVGALGGGINDGLSQMLSRLSMAQSYGGFGGGFGTINPGTFAPVSNPYADVSAGGGWDLSSMSTSLPPVF